MIPFRHPPTSVRARRGYARVRFDDGSGQDVALEAFGLLRDATAAAQRAVRLFVPAEQAETIPLMLSVRGLFGEEHVIDLLHVTHVAAWPPSAVALEAADTLRYDLPEEREPWKS